MTFFAVSDLHIRSAQDPLYGSLLALLRERARADDVLVLAGDVFDVFVGPKEPFLSEYEAFFSELRSALERGVTIHYVEGNHDFQLGRVFSGLSGMHHHPESVVLELGGKRFFVAHGDLADAKDYRYRILRGFLRSPPLRAAIRLAPGSLVAGIGRRASRYGGDRPPQLPSELSTERLSRLRTVYRSFAAEKLAQGYDFVVMGHCHDLDEKEFRIGERIGQYINIGYPRAHGSLLSWNEGEAKIGREKLPVSAR